MLSSLNLRNLKCFEALRLELGCLTLLTGFNAAGKSTSYQPLLLLAQALRANPNSDLVGLNGSLARLGTVGETLATSGSDRPLAIGLKTPEIEVEWTLLPTERLGGGAFAIESGVARLGREKPIVWTGKLLPDDRELPAMQAVMKIVQGTIFISATRLGTAEAFPTPDEGNISRADVGPRGEYAPWWYAQFADEEIEAARRHPDEPGLTLRRQVDAFLNDIFPGGQANAEIIARTSLIRLGLRTNIESDWRRPANTGYGLTYAFPIVIALLLAGPDQVVIIDSPEAHLHPRGQSVMGRLLARFAAAGVQIIVETHSDHILNGIRCAVREKTIEANSTAIYFFKLPEDRKKEQQVFRLKIDAAGGIDAWPTGFFDQAERDLAKLADWE
jgi:predicted ATPase